MKRLTYISAIAAALLAVCGCQPEVDGVRSVLGKDAITFGAAIEKGTNKDMTKASPLCTSDGSYEIPLWTVVTDGIAQNDASATKGAQLNTTGENQALATYASQIGSKFYVAAWEGTDRFIPAAVTSGTQPQYEQVSYSAENGWTSANTYKWKDDQSLTFYAYANLPATVEDEVEASIACGASTEQVLTYSVVPADATKQNDILMGYFTGTGDDNKDDSKKLKKADITFYHPMTAVRFVKGEFTGMESVKFKAIYLSQIYKSGTATMTPTSIAAEDPGDKFAWTNLSSTMQQAVLKASGDGYLAVDATTFVIGEPFIIIPQNLESKPVKIVIEVEIDGVTNYLSTTCDSGTWAAGKTNTYKLSKDGYEWEYSFSADWNSYTFDTNKEYEQNKTNSIYSYRTRSDDASIKEHVNWKIKSYRIGDGEEVTVDALSYAYDPSWTKVSATLLPTRDYDFLNAYGKAVNTAAKGKHVYWINSDSRTDDLDWSPADWSVYGDLDLSKIDVYSDSPSNAHGMTTANCYIIRHSGTYMIPLVYGNAMKNGEENTHSYCTEDISGGTKRLSRFLNHRNAGIFSAFIENNTGCIATSYEILWQSDADVVSVTGFSSATPSSTGGFNKNNVRYLKFTVPENTVEQSNALIAIKDSAGDIIWSWHIWVTNDPEVISDAIKVTNYYGQDYYFYPVDNIGTISSAEYLPRPDITVTLQQDEPSGKTITLTLKQQLFQAKTSSLMYEWGRKDPFLKKNTDYAGNNILTYTQDPNSTVVSGILNPKVWYGFDFEIGPYGEYEWASPLYANLWSGIESGYAIIEKSNRTIKTIYDPSPIGYMVPTIGAFSGFDTRVGKHGDFNHSKECWNVVDTRFDNGYTFYTSLGPGHTVNTSGPTITFHADGMRAGNGAEFQESRGWFHSSILHDSKNAAIFMVEENEVTSYNTASPSNGYSVRPILEDVPTE